MVQGYIRELRLKAFEGDPGLLRLRRAARILLCAVLSLLAALLLSSALENWFRLGEGPGYRLDPRLVFPALLASLLLAGNISGDTGRARRLTMLRNFLAALGATVPAVFVSYWSLGYWLLLTGLAFFAFYLRRFGTSWGGMGILMLVIGMFIPRMGIAPEHLPRFWAVLLLSFLCTFFVSFHLFPVRLRRALLDCLARFLGSVAQAVGGIRRGLDSGGLPASSGPPQPVRFMRETLFLWGSIAAGVISREDPAWELLEEAADIQFRLGKLLKIARSGLVELVSSPAGCPVAEASAALAELESVLAGARADLLTGESFSLDLAGYQGAVARLAGIWESRPGPLDRDDVQLGRVVLALERMGELLASLSDSVSGLPGEAE